MAIFEPKFINEGKRSDLPDSSFGIPEDRKYPLDTKEHVKSAIKLFGHAEESKKKSLARRIQNAAKKYNIDIPENTQCYKYLHESISESTHKNIEYKTISSSNPEFKKYLKKYNIVKDPDSVSKEYNGDILIDIKEDKLIGHVFIGNTKDKGFITDLVVNKKYRKLGFGNMLLDSAMHKYHGVDLTVRKNNSIAIDMYKKHGFVVDDSLDAGKDMYYMSLKSNSKNESYIEEKTNTDYDIESIVKEIHNKTISDKKEPTGNQNCLLCTWCTEAQIRGYKELPRPVYSPRDSIFTHNGYDIVKNPSKIKIKNVSNVKDIVTKSGNNSRYYVHVNWKGSKGGHEFMLLNKNNEVYVVDSQAGLVASIESFKGSYYFNDINYNNSFLVRLDDKKFNKSILKYNDPSYTLEWDEDKDIKYLRSHGMSESYIEEAYIKKEYSLENITDIHIKSAFDKVCDLIKWCRMDDVYFCSCHLFNNYRSISPTSFEFARIEPHAINEVVKTCNRNNHFMYGEFSVNVNNENILICEITKLYEFEKQDTITESSSYNYFITNDNGNEHFNVAKYFQMIMFQELDAYMVGNHIHPRDIESDNGCYTIATYTIDDEFNKDHVFNFLNHVSNMINNSITSKYELCDMSSGILGVRVKPGHENEVIDDIDNKVCSNFGWTNNDITLENIDEAATGTIIPKRFKIFYGDKILNKKVIEPKITKFNRKEIQATTSIREAGLECFNTDSENIDVKIVDDIIKIYIDRKDFDLANECVIYELKNDGKWFYKEGDPTGAYRRDSNAVVVDKYEFYSVTEMMSMLGGYELYDYKTKLPINKLLEDGEIELKSNTTTPHMEVLNLGFTDEQDEKAKDMQKRNPELVIFNLDDAYLSIKKLDEKLNKFKGLSEKQRKLCNRISLSIFDYNMYDMYNKLSVIVNKYSHGVKDIELSNDSRLTDIELVSTSDNETLRNFKEEIKQEATSIGRDKAKIAYKLLDLYNSRNDMTFTESVNTKRFIEETIEDLNNPLIDVDIDRCAYFTPQKMLSMGVFNDNAEDNFYNCESTKESLDWFNKYCICNEITDKEKWYIELKKVYIEMLKNPIPENKQRVLEMGWNPELYPSFETVKKASDITKYTIAESMNIVNIDARNLSDTSITESSVKNNDLEPIFIVTSFTETLFGKVIRKVTNGRYTHASLSFDTSLESLYSFNLVNKVHRSGGLSFESISNYIKECPDALIKVQAIFVKPSDMKIIKMKIDEYVANYKNTSYNVANCFDVAINRACKSKDFSMICSEFVASILKAANIDITNGKSPNIVTPKDLSTVVNNKVYLIYEGFADRYNAKEADKLVNKIKSKAKYIKEYAKLYSDNITTMLESFINIDEKAKVEISDDGDILIKDFKKINFESEYYHSSKLLKTYAQNDNYDGMKYELAKLWYLNNLLENKLYGSKLKISNTKELNKTRSKILNLFNRNLKIVTKAEPEFDFTSYYQTTPFYDNNITIKKSTVNGVLDIIKRII